MMLASVSRSYVVYEGWMTEGPASTSASVTACDLVIIM